MKCNVNPISYSRSIRAIALLCALAISAEVRATPIEFSAELLEDDGRTFFVTLSIDSSELDAQSSLIEEVSDFIGIVDGITYSWGPVLPILRRSTRVRPTILRPANSLPSKRLSSQR